MALVIDYFFEGRDEYSACCQTTFFLFPTRVTLDPDQPLCAFLCLVFHTQFKRSGGRHTLPAILPLPDFLPSFLHRSPPTHSRRPLYFLGLGMGRYVATTTAWSRS